MRALHVFLVAGAAAALALVLAPTLGQAQPWRVVKNGRVTYTSNIEDLPAAKRAKILEKWKNADGKIVPPAKPDPVAEPVRDLPTEGVKAVEGGKPDAEEKAETPAAAPRIDPRAKAQSEAVALAVELTSARAELDTARRKAYTVPSGRAYEERNQAEERVRKLESDLAAAKARGGI